MEKGIQGISKFTPVLLGFVSGFQEPKTNLKKKKEKMIDKKVSNNLSNNTNSR